MKTIQYFTQDITLFELLRDYNHWIYRQVRDYAHEHMISWEEVDLEGLFGGCIHISTSDEDMEDIQRIAENAPEAIISHMEIREINVVTNYGELELANNELGSTTLITTYSLITNNSGGDIFIMVTSGSYKRPLR